MNANKLIETMQFDFDRLKAELVDDKNFDKDELIDAIECLKASIREIERSSGSAMTER